MGRVANKVLLLFCIRYLDNLKEQPTIEEVFISPTHIYDRPTGKIIGSGILEMLKTQNIDIKNCRTQVLRWCICHGEGKRSISCYKRATTNG